MSLNWDHHRFVEFAAKGDKSAVEDFLRRGVSIDQADTVGGKLTALVAASDKNQLAIVKLLLEAGANVNTPSGYGETALLRACRLGYGDIAERLLEAGAAPNVECGFAKTTALLEALGFLGSAGIVEALLQSGADPNGLPNSPQAPPLLRVCGESSLQDAKAIDLLLKAGAQRDALSKDGENALHLAARWCEPPKILRLLKAGLDPNLKTPSGSTALHIAASAPRNAGAIAMLLEAGARKEEPAPNQKTAFDLALANLYFPIDKLEQLMTRPPQEEDLLIILQSYFDEAQGEKALWILDKIPSLDKERLLPLAQKWRYEPLIERLEASSRR